MSDFFHALTPEWVLKAVEAGGFHPTGHVTPLMCLENRVYDLRLDGEASTRTGVGAVTGSRGSSGDPHVVAKFYRPGRWSREAILEEHALLAELRAAEIPVCAPLTFADGGTLHEVEGIHYAVWPRTGGRPPDEFSDEHLQVVGRLLARIHAVGAASESIHRQRLDGSRAVLGPLEQLEERVLPPEVAGRYRAAVEEVARLYDAWSEGVPLHRIHGDCHAGNLLNGEEGWFFLDFDDFVVGPAVHDIWMLLPGRDAEGVRQRAVLIEAYRQFRDFDADWLRLVEPLRAFRFVIYAAWIARRWQDPAFPDAFPHFGSADYWQNETRDLEEQVERLHREGGDAVPETLQRAAETEPELTNEEIFWDL